MNQKEIQETTTKIFSVYELTLYIKNKLETDNKLNNILVRGEVSNLVHSSSGHIYFSLKDEKSQIRCILFRNSNNLKFKLEHGLKIIVKGKINLYEIKGEYSLIIDEIQPDGLGALHLAFLQLKRKLEEEGLFKKEYKKPIPKFPRNIAIITSETGSVIKDVINITKRRYPLVSLKIIPTLVQGEEAARSIVNSIVRANTLEIDLIILARGGGSLEDLWPFNEEIVARAIFNSKIPIVSAIGHETDFTISDFTADLRAPTPSSAIEILLPDVEEIKKFINMLNKRSINSIINILNIQKTELNQIKNRQIFKRPFDKIYSNKQELDHLTFKLQSLMKEKLTLTKKQLEILDSKLKSINPKAILKMGYSIIVKDNKTIKDSKEVDVDNDINIVLYKGKLDAKITGKEEEDG